MELSFIDLLFVLIVFFVFIFEFALFAFNRLSIEPQLKIRIFILC